MGWWGMSNHMDRAARTSLSDGDQRARFANLRIWNLGVGLAHLVQGVVILVISAGFAIPIVATVQSGPPGAPGSLDRSTTFFEISFPIAVAVFLFLAAADHLLMAAPSIRGWYEANLRRGINVARWAEYSVSASIMIVLIGLLVGVNNLYAIIAIAGVNASMILFGLVMEKVNTDRSDVDWWPFVFGCIAGIIPWIIVTTALVVATVEAEPGTDGVPPFVFVIYVTLFLLFNCFALNQWLQYRGKGKFADYLYGEKVYLVLSLVAKTALAWQIYFGTLAD
jgi:sulfite exporter TauE/SafE